MSLELPPMRVKYSGHVSLSVSCDDVTSIIRIRIRCRNMVLLKHQTWSGLVGGSGSVKGSGLVKGFGFVGGSGLIGVIGAVGGSGMVEGSGSI